MNLPEITLPITDPVLIFALVMVLMLVLPLLFQRLRVPGIVGLIIAGVVFGPNGLGVLARDQTIQLLGTVGLLYIMFIAGLEVDMNEFRRQRYRSILFGAATFLLPQTLGMLAGRLLLGFDWIAATLLGAVFASHTLLAYPILSKLGLGKSEVVTTGVGGTILTDTAALLILGVIARTAAGSITVLFWVQLTVLLTAYVALVFWGVPRLGRWFFQRVRSDGVFEFVFVLAVVFVCAYMASVAGVEPIIGAFLAGLALNRLVPEHSTLMNRTRFVGESIFIPFFLLSVGMLVDVRMLAGGADAWMVAGIMVGTVILAKWSAAQLTRTLFGYSSDEAWMLFGLTIPQAAATLATVLIGYNVGIFGDAVLNGTILMMLVTCMLGPWVSEHYGRVVALREARTPFDAGRTPQRILVPLANPQTAASLMDLAFMIRQPRAGQPIYPLSVVRNAEDPAIGVAAGEKLLAHAVVHAAAADVPVTPLVRLDHNVARGILRGIREQLISTVIIGWNGRSSGGQYTFGSILDQLLAESREQVLVTRVEKPLVATSRVVLAVPPNASFEPGVVELIGTIKLLAGQLSARLCVITTDADLSALMPLIDRAPPELTTEHLTLRWWTRLLDEYQTQARPNDLFVLVSARQASLTWRPSLNRLPNHFAQRFPDGNLLIAYPGSLSADARSDPFPSADLVLGGLLSTDRILVDLKARTADAALNEMLRPAMRPMQPLSHLSVGALPLSEADYVPELLPGAMLYHAHIPGIHAPLLFVGVSRRGVKLSSAPERIYVMLALLTPVNGRPEDHVRSLALVARLLRGVETIDRLRNASDPGEVREILASSFLDPLTRSANHAVSSDAGSAPGL